MERRPQEFNEVENHPDRGPQWSMPLNPAIHCRDADVERTATIEIVDPRGADGLRRFVRDGKIVVGRLVFRHLDPTVWHCL